jgi:hypothetical protein
VIRPATAPDAPAVAGVWWRSRLAAVPAIPAPVHDEADVGRWVADVLVPGGGTWVALEDGRVVAMLSLSPGWVDQLAMQRSPGGLDLWAFQANTAARRFYERHGFTAVAWTDGDNEEGAPDVRYRWAGADAETPPPNTA